MREALAGRNYARVYRTVGKADLHALVRAAVERAGGRVLYESPPTRAPLYLGVQGPGDERLGILAYLFRATRNEIRNRPVDEHRLQVRLGGEARWQAEEHPLGRDVAGVDVTVVLGVHVEAGLLIGLDPLRYDPLPMGISIEFKDEHVAAAQAAGWHVWERDNLQGRVRAARAPQGLEAMVAFRPERLLDYVRLEHQAASLALDPPLRFRAAVAAGERADQAGSARHALERDFALSSQEILDIISQRMRLSVAVRGGVAEHHLAKALGADPAVAAVEAIDRDGGDFAVRLGTGREVLVECKNASPTRYSDGAMRVEVQKTRASKNDPASRYYRVDQFDVVAACLFPATQRWEFAYHAASRLRRHEQFPDRLAALQRIDRTWGQTLTAALSG